MIDCGHNTTTGWRPSTFIRNEMGRTKLDYLFVTNADQDHLSDLEGLWTQNVNVKCSTAIRRLGRATCGPILPIVARCLLSAYQAERWYAQALDRTFGLHLDPLIAT
jgi:hypothetical protein